MAQLCMNWIMLDLKGGSWELFSLAFYARIKICGCILHVPVDIGFMRKHSLS